VSVGAPKRTAAHDWRVQRRDAVSRRIEHVALDLFTEHGFTAVSVDDVAAAAGISERTFFRYFDSKSDVLLGYRRRLDRRLLQALRDRPTDEGAITALRRAYLETATVPPADREQVLRRARAVAAAPSLLARSRGEQMRGIDALAAELATRMDVASDDPRPRIAATAMSTVANAEWEAWVMGDGHGDPAASIAAALDVLEAGLRSLDRVSGEDG
jgi:AcrR family transcriptional regulator